MRKSKTPNIDLTGYRYTNRIPATEYFPPYAFTSPVRRVDTKKNWNPDPGIIELTSLTGIDVKNEQLAKSLKTHQGRIRIYHAISFLITSILYFSIGVLTLYFVVGIFIFIGLITTGTVPERITSNILVFILCIIVYVAFRLADRITSTIIDRYYADALAYSVCLKLLIHLNKEDSLMLVSDRQHILVRIRALRRYIILLSYQYSVADLASANWARNKFKQMEDFIREKESQIIAPRADTQSKIIDELNILLPILLTSQYGEFMYTSVVETEVSTVSQTGPTRSWLLKFLGMVSPLVLLFANYFFKTQFQAIGLDNQLIALIGLAWLLLAVDANLNLGIVDRIAGLAKAIRELR